MRSYTYKRRVAFSFTVTISACVQLVKQVSWLFPAFNYFMTLAIDKMDGGGHINIAHREHLPKKTKVMWY